MISGDEMDKIVLKDGITIMTKSTTEHKANNKMISPYARVGVVGNQVKTTRILNLLNDLENVCIQFLSGSNVLKFLTITNLYP